MGAGLQMGSQPGWGRGPALTLFLADSHVSGPSELLPRASALRYCDIANGPFAARIFLKHRYGAAGRKVHGLP